VTGDLLNVSATGALVKVARELPVGSEGPLLLDPDARRIDLFGRVVRCARMTIELPGAILKQSLFAAGVMFTYASASAVEGIAQLCGGAIAIEELPCRVIVVSVNEETSAALGRTMSHAGYHVRLVGDPRQTLAAAKESHADAVVVDLHDNERHVGWLLDVLATDAATAALPALVLADADVLDADRRRTLDARGVRVVPPTFSSDELLAAVAETLNARRPR
jgi:CheY-like chemotaxis protein